MTASAMNTAAILKMAAKIHLNSHYPKMSQRFAPIYGAATNYLEDRRPDITEYSSAGYRLFILKTDGETPSPRAAEAVQWLSDNKIVHEYEFQLTRNSIWIRFPRGEDAALFKLFWM
jgi:hypothetical protein